jgi:hypothetical protein
VDLRVDSFLIEDGTRREVLLSGVEGHADLCITFDLVDEYEVPLPEVLDGFVNSAVYFAMEMGQPVHVHGELSREYLIHLSLFQEAWASLRPERYTRVEVIPAAVRDHVQAGPARAISAYTGGVDSMFTLHRNTQRGRDLGSLPIEAVLFAQFSNKRDKGSPSKLFAKARPLLESRGVELKTLRSDIRESGGGQSWIDAHAAMLNACLYNFAPRYGMAVLGSTEPLRAMVLPWGSNPATDPLLSSPAMPFFHDGAGATRTEKVASIAADVLARRALQVCLKQTDENCGICRKCLRTRLNFMAVGVDDLEAFSGPLDLRAIDRAEIKTEVDCGELRGILDYAAGHGIDAEWTRRLQARVDRHRPDARMVSQLRRWRTSARRSLKSVLR